MNNKLLAALAMTTALVTGLQAQCQINSGAYVGISAGGAHLAGKNDLTYTNQAQGYNDTLPGSLSSSSFAGSIFAGYGLKFNSLWGALELFYQFDNTKSSKNVNFGNGNPIIQSKSNGAWGGAVHLGYMPTNNSIIYAIVGAEVRRFKVTATDGGGAAAVNKIEASISKSYTSTAFAPGIGVRVLLCKNLSLRTEYKYAKHQNKSLSASQAKQLVGAGNDSITLKHSPTVHSFNVGLVYSF
ncbi:MAG: outer membrane beta-barrel protein [Alphaproteobacteria bacterium]